MTFHHSAATIAIHIFFILSLATLFINASKDQDISDLNIDITKIRLLHEIKTHILSKIFTEFLTFHEILTLRTTCMDFQILIFPNDDNNVVFCKDFGSKEMHILPLIWFNKENINMNWFHDLGQRRKDMVVALLTQGIQAYNGFDQNLVMDMQTKLRILPSQTQQLYKFLSLEKFILKRFLNQSYTSALKQLQ